VGLQPRLIDGDPRLLEQSYRLRYQVYCVERRFLHVEDYPDGLERDAFDGDSIHVGAVDSHGELVATARVVKPNKAGLPLFRYCTLFSHETTFNEVGNTVVEVSRVSISRRHARRRDDPPAVVSEADARALVPTAGERRERYTEPFLTLLKAVIYGARRAGATHLIGATDLALHRWLVHYGFPYRLAGPEVEYYGPIAPYIMSLAEFDQVALSRKFAALDGFPVGPESALAPGLDVEGPLLPVGGLVDG
jgi:N-acyl amino acid synthase of PEP-CTERM/exosortase system